MTDTVYIALAMGGLLGGFVKAWAAKEGMTIRTILLNTVTAMASSVIGLGYIGPKVLDMPLEMSPVFAFFTGTFFGVTGAYLTVAALWKTVWKDK